MKKLLIFVCWLMGYGAVAQQQVTNFGNAVLKFPAKAELVDTINHKALFNIMLDESSERSLWVTDGNAGNTRHLKDAFGESPPYIGDKVRKYGYLYLKGLALWRTDGNILERVIPNTGTPERVFDVSGRILLTRSHYETFNDVYFNLTSFVWLDSLNYTTQWEEDVVSYQIIDSTLHYIKYNRYTQLYELYQLYKNGGLSKNIITRKISAPVTKFEYLFNNGIEYYFLDTNTGKKLITKSVDSTQEIDYQDWGGKTFFPAFVNDTKQQTYFLKHQGSLTVYQLSESNHLTEKWTVPSDTVLKISGDFMFYYVVDYNPWLINEDKLIFKIHIGVEGLIRYYFNKLDLQKGTFQRSRNLLEYFRYYYDPLNITPLDADTYVLDNTANLKITYNFKKDSVLAVNPYPVKESIIDLNGKKIQFSGNIYALSGATKTPLLPEKQIFDKQEGTSFIVHAQLGSQLLFVRYNAECQCYELWANKGEKNSSTFLLSFKEQYQQLIEVSQSKAGYFKGKLYIHARDYQTNTSIIYETDGTKAGTKKIYISDRYLLNLIKFNEKQLVFGLNYGVNKILIFEDQAWKLIDIPETRNSYDVYLTSEETYVLTKSIAGYKDRIMAYNELFRVEGDSLKLVDKDVEQVLVVQDKIYYLRRINYEDTNPFTLHFTDASQVIKDPVKDVIYTFGVYGNKLLYQKVVSGTLVDCAIMDLTTQRIEAVVNRIALVAIAFVNDVLIVGESQRVYFIKDSKVTAYKMEFQLDFMSPFSGGVFFGNSINLMYYDVSEYKAYPIIKGSTYTTPSFTANSTYFIISTSFSGTITNSYYWTLADKKLIEFEEVGRFEALNSSLVVHLADYKAKIYIWSLNKNKFTQKYEIQYYDYLNWKRQVGNDFYIPYTTESRGTEMAKFGPDRLINLPEIVVGKEGISFGDVFEFGGRIFVYAYTKSAGWQVWRMDNNPSLILGNETVLEPEKLKVYPNPTQDLLYINSEKTLPYKLINTRGQLLMQGNLSSQDGVNMKQLPQGVYLIQLLDGGKVYVKKVVRE